MDRSCCGRDMTFRGLIVTAKVSINMLLWLKTPYAGKEEQLSVHGVHDVSVSCSSTTDSHQHSFKNFYMTSAASVPVL